MHTHYWVVAPSVASRGNRLLVFLPTPLSSPLLSPSSLRSPRLWKCSNPLVSVWIPLSWTEQPKTLLLAGLGKEKAVCTAHSLRRAPFTALSVDKKKSKRERLWDWVIKCIRARERATVRQRKEGKRTRQAAYWSKRAKDEIRTAFYKRKKRKDRRRGTPQLVTWDTVSVFSSSWSPSGFDQQSIGF